MIYVSWPVKVLDRKEFGNVLKVSFKKNRTCYILAAIGGIRDRSEFISDDSRFTAATSMSEI